jgi:hypothetical protein
MYINVTESIFMDAFNSLRPDNFSYAGLRALFEYYEDDENEELDVIAICCEWEEFTREELLDNYSHLFECEDDDYLDNLDASDIVDTLNQETTIIELDNGSFLLQAF